MAVWKGTLYGCMGRNTLWLCGKEHFMAVWKGTLYGCMGRNTLWLCGKGLGGIVQELCESRGGRPGLSVLTSLLVSVDVKQY